MKKFILPIVLLLVGVGLGYLIPHGASDSKVGGYRRTADYFNGGFYAGESDQFSVDTSGNLTTTGNYTTTGSGDLVSGDDLTVADDATVTDLLTAARFASGSVGSSSSSPAVLGSAVSGHFVLAASATTASASTTAVTANSTIILQNESTTPIAGTTCNVGAATSTVVSVDSKIAGNGFIVRSETAPATNPLCLSYLIIN